MFIRHPAGLFMRHPSGLFVRRSLLVERYIVVAGQHRSNGVRQNNAWIIPESSWPTSGTTQASSLGFDTGFFVTGGTPTLSGAAFSNVPGDQFRYRLYDKTGATILTSEVPTPIRPSATPDLSCRLNQDSVYWLGDANTGGANPSNPLLIYAPDGTVSSALTPSSGNFSISSAFVMKQRGLHTTTIVYNTTFLIGYVFCEGFLPAQQGWYALPNTANEFFNAWGASLTPSSPAMATAIDTAGNRFFSAFSGRIYDFQGAGDTLQDTGLFSSALATAYAGSDTIRTHDIDYRVENGDGKLYILFSELTGTTTTLRIVKLTEPSWTIEETVVVSSLTDPAIDAYYTKPCKIELLSDGRVMCSDVGGTRLYASNFAEHNSVHCFDAELTKQWTLDFYSGSDFVLSNDFRIMQDFSIGGRR